MRITYLFFVAVAFCCFAAPTANGQSILEPFLTFDGPVNNDPDPVFGVPFQGGGEDKLQDDSLTAFFDVDMSGGLSVNDILVNVITLSEINSSNAASETIGTNEQITLVLSQTVTGPGSAAGSFALGPTAAANALSLTNLFGAVPGVAGNIGPNSIGLLFSTPMGAASANANDPSGSNDPLNWTFAFLSGNFGVAGAGGWAWEATAGLTPGVNSHGSADFSELLPDPLGGGTVRGGATIEAIVFPINGWLPVDVFDFAGNTHLNDFTNDVATFAPASQNEQDRGWFFRDQGSFFVNPGPPTEDCDARTIGFWGNRHGLAIIAELDCLDDLAALNLRNQDGSDFDPTTLSQWRSWLRGANSENMAYMLSAQMAGMFLNIKAGFVGADDMVVVDGELLDISDVIDAANEVLGLDPIPDGDGLLELVSGHPDAEQPASDYVTPLAPFGEGTLREYAGFLKNILDDGNNNLNWENCNPPAKFNMGGLEGLEGLDGLGG